MTSQLLISDEQNDATSTADGLRFPMNNNHPTRRWWTVKEIAVHYGVSGRTIYDAIASSLLVVHRFGIGRGAIRIADEDRHAWETACRAKANSVPASSLSFTTPITASPLLAKHFGPRPSKLRPSCGPTASPNTDKRD